MPIEDVGPFWPAGWPMVVKKEGPGVHQIRVYGHAGRTLIDVHCVCGAYLGSHHPTDEYMKGMEMFHEHEKEVAGRGAQG